MPILTESPVQWYVNARGPVVPNVSIKNVMNVVKASDAQNEKKSNVVSGERVDVMDVKNVTVQNVMIYN